MSEENVDLLRRGFDLFARGEIDALLELLHDDAEWAPGIAPILGVESLHGKEQIRRFFTKDLYEGFDSFHAEPQSMQDFGDEILVESRYAGRGESSGLEMDQVYWSVYWIRDGKLAAFRDYETREQALDAIAATTRAASSPRT